MPADLTATDPFIAANFWPTLCISTPHVDGGGTARMWCISPQFAEELSGRLGEPHMVQLISAEHMAATQPIVDTIPTLIEGDDHAG